MPSERVGGIDITYVDSGSGSPLLMLHGFTGSRLAWQGIEEDLARRFRVIAINLIGHGETSAPDDPGRYTIRRAVEDILQLLDRLEISRAAVLGYSMGGRVAMNLALTAPERLSSLVLESASPGILDPEERRRRAESDERLAMMIEEQRVTAFIDYWEALPLFASQARLDPDVRRRQRELRLAQSPIGLANSLRGMGAGAMEPVTDRLIEFGVPVLYLAGEDDEKYREIGASMVSRMPNGRFHVVPGAGHTIHLEQPERYVNLVSQFLASDGN